MSSSYPNFLDWAGRARSFQAHVGVPNAKLSTCREGQPERVRVAMVSAPFFQLLGLKPALGRTFTAAEDQRGAPPVVVIGTAYWKERFGGNLA